MVDKKTVDAYKRIKASEELKNRVLSQKSMKKNTSLQTRVFYKIASAAAACLVVALAVTFITLNNFNTVRVIADSKTVGEEPVAVSSSNSSARGISTLNMDSEIFIELELKNLKNTKLNVSAGYIMSPEGEKYNSQHIFNGSCYVVWVLDSSSRDLSELTVGNFVYELLYDNALSQWTISKTK